MSQSDREVDQAIAAVGRGFSHPLSVSEIAHAKVDIFFQRVGEVDRKETTVIIVALSQISHQRIDDQQALSIAAEVLSGQSMDPTRGATFYHADYVSPRWADAYDKTEKIGHHVFYGGLRAEQDLLAMQPHLGARAAFAFPEGLDLSPFDAIRTAGSGATAFARAEPVEFNATPFSVSGFAPPAIAGRFDQPRQPMPSEITSAPPGDAFAPAQLLGPPAPLGPSGLAARSTSLPAAPNIGVHPPPASSSRTKEQIDREIEQLRGEILDTATRMIGQGADAGPSLRQLDSAGLIAPSPGPIAVGAGTAPLLAAPDAVSLTSATAGPSRGGSASATGTIPLRTVPVDLTVAGAFGPPSAVVAGKGVDTYDLLRSVSAPARNTPLAAPGSFRPPSVSAGLSGTALANPSPTVAALANRPISVGPSISDLTRSAAAAPPPRQVTTQRVTLPAGTPFSPTVAPLPGVFTPPPASAQAKSLMTGFEPGGALHPGKQEDDYLGPVVKAAPAVAAPKPLSPHATSTPIGDEREIEAIREVFGPGEKCPPIAATKSLTGHSLGATGVQESIYCMLMMQNGFIFESGLHSRHRRQSRHRSQRRRLSSAGFPGCCRTL